MTKSAAARERTAQEDRPDRVSVPCHPAGAALYFPWG